ncbi:MAG: caspase family protein [Lewinellaceae bacterium]|nr:caspase family protein [Lewinellaceae bacterium]
MRIVLPYLFLLALPFWASAQTTAPNPSAAKSATPLAPQNAKLNTQNSTRAVVIGISDYQEKDIPDLRFADRDAEAFANFLRSPGGGGLSSENLRVLTNEKATAGQVIAALTWLLDESKPGDQAIIYFSGHGDVEAKLLNQLGFLLLWDSPAHVYLAGALPVDMLRQVVSTLSIEQKTRVFVVVDACRAGKLAGNTVIGTQLTSNQLAQQFSQEQKVLSCQPNEFSIEGEQWGGGRGVFSYHLCNGLYGLADDDRNGQVSLFEIGRYLEDRVPKEVSPLSQLPLTVGDKSGTLFSVDGPTLAALEKQGTPPANIAKVEQRGVLQEALAKADSSVRFWYAGFERTLRGKNFFQPDGDCVEYFFQKLLATESIVVLHPALRRNYAAALQDDAQQVINRWLKSSVKELSLTKVKQSLKYRLYPLYLERAADLLGARHYMYPVLQARKFYFEGYLMHIDYRHANRDLGEKALAKYREALKWQPESPHVYSSMMYAHFYLMQQPDSAEYYARQATASAPFWIIPYTMLGFMYIDNTASQNYNKAKAFFRIGRPG